MGKKPYYIPTGRPVGRPPNSEVVIVSEVDAAVLPPLPKAAEARWDDATRRCTSKPLLRDMRLRLAGYTQRQIEALNEDARGRDTINQALRRYSLLEISRQLTSERIVDNHREIAVDATELQLEELGKEDGKPSTALAIVAGISTDKVANAEKWASRSTSSENLGDSLVEIAERIVKAGGSLDLHIKGPGGSARIEAGDE